MWHISVDVSVIFDMSADIIADNSDIVNVLIMLHWFLFKYVLSTMGVSKESISKFLIGN